MPINLLPFLPALLGAAGSIGSALIQKGAADSGAAVAREERADDRAHQIAMQAKEEALQREFAQQGVRWRVEDAKAAGIHPAFALGASGASYSPVGISPLGQSGAGSIIAEAGSQMGQNFSRAIDATRTTVERMDPYVRATENLTLERMGLENQLLKVQIGQAGNPPFPGSRYAIDGQTGSGIIIGGRTIMPHPAMDDASKIQDRYGELGEWLYGVPVIAADAIKHGVDSVPKAAWDVLAGKPRGQRRGANWR